MKSFFTILLSCMISLSLMGQKGNRSLVKDHHSKKDQHGITTLEEKIARNPEFASRLSSLQFSAIRIQRSSLKAATANKQMLDSILWEIYDLTNSLWLSDEKELFVYDVHGNVISYLLFAYDDLEMKFLPSEKELIKYNDQGNPTEIEVLTWAVESGLWFREAKIVFSYDGAGNPVQQLAYSWEPVGLQWLVAAQFDMTYDESGNLESELWSFWEEDSAKLVPAYRDEYLYENGELSIWYEYFWEEGDWVLVYRTTYTYDPKGNLTEELTQGYDSEFDEWIDFGLILYTYNEADQLIAEEEWEFDWFLFDLVQSWHYSYTWDNEGNMKEQIESSWDEGLTKGSASWLNAFKSEWTFNKDFTINNDIYGPFWFWGLGEELPFVHMPVSELGSIYQNEAWVNDFKQTAYYSDFSASTGIEDKEESHVTVFPVPAFETITFSWDHTYTRLNLELYDITGKQHISRSIDNNETIEVNDLPSGIYLYKLGNSGELIQTGKISIN